MRTPALRHFGSLPALLLAVGVSATSAAEPADVLVADFEGKNYGNWKVEGEALGPGPARGTLPRQMNVTGFEGKGLVNTFSGGDGATGTLTSPPVKIERKFINFLIGGGGYKGTTCMNLLVDGQIVRTATGPNTRPGGSEALDWEAWDVGDLAGKTATIQIVDNRTGGWGHVNVDHILQSDRRRGAEPASREIVIEHRYLHLPIKNGARKCRMSFVVDGKPARTFDIELAAAEPDFQTFTDVGEFRGKTLRIEVDKAPYGSRGLASIRQSDAVPAVDSMYREKHRPQFHFSPRRGWTNDPNGLVYHDGEYHLFFQHNPYGIRWGNMTWGHAVSSDLLHWKELADAIHPDRLGTIFSGSAVVDRDNTTGWAKGDRKPIVCIYTSAGRCVRPPVPYTQSIAYSVDRGRTWTKYGGNPVLKNIHGGNRDPKVLWHQPSGQWVMILYLDRRGEFGLFGSPDLKRWTRLSDLPFPGGHECPDLFELAVDGDLANKRWVAWEGGGRYMVGRFDGKTFTTESGPHGSKFGANDYAAQTYSDIPAEDGRRIMIAWMAGGKYPEMPFNQQMSIPRVLTLRTTGAGIRLFTEPVAEIEKLHGKHHAFSPVDLKPEANPLAGLSGELFEVRAEIEPGSAAEVGLDVRGVHVQYNVKEKNLSCLGKTAPLELVDGRIKLQVVVDRTSLEVFANDGRVQMCSCFLPKEDSQGLGVFATGGTAKIVSLDVWELKPIWHTD